MQRDRFLLEEYPYDGTFYRSSVDETLPLDQQVEREYIVAEVKCDIQESSHARSWGHIQSIYAIYVHNDNATEDIPVQRGMLFRAYQHGVLVAGKVTGIFPSQMNGYVCYIQCDEV